MKEAERQKYLQLVTRKLVSLTAGCMVILIIVFYIMPYIFHPEQTYLVGIVFLTGLIGGFVSIQQRLPTVGLNELRELSESWVSILLIPINGGIFAMVLMFMFVSGILEGSLFPKYSQPDILQDNIIESFQNWLRASFPQSGPDVAKLLFWSFVAGFSERLVPQIIRKTAEKVDNQ
ncbi:MAG: hypothetical protein ABSE05_09600 [Syntrophales bacterium]|jgi:O-antigen/teichoic acid export membrane protein